MDKLSRVIRRVIKETVIDKPSRQEKESSRYMFFSNLEQMRRQCDLLLDLDHNMVMEGRKKTGTKLCARGKSAAKAKFDVYPSAYANGYAVQVCKGTKPGLDGKKRCSGVYC